jgi:CotH protein/lamin tail-like protein
MRKLFFAVLWLWLLAPGAQAQLRITEFMASNDRTLADEDGDFPDWIEIANLGGTAKDISGWFLTDDVSNLQKWQFPATTTVVAGGFLVVYASDKNRAAAGAPLHTNFKLKASGEYLALVLPDGISVAHEFAPQYPTQYTDASFGLVYDPNPTTELSYFATPTPGLANGTGGPVVVDVTYSPALPVVGDDLTVTAEIPSAVTQVDLHWRVMYGTETSVAMRDDGAGVDLLAGDGKWTALIPASGGSQTGEMLRWYVTATDSSGRTGRAPLFANPVETPEYFGLMVQDPATVSDLPIFYWFVEDPLAAATVAGSQCSVYFLNEFYDNVKVRIRGGNSLAWPKPNYKFDFHAGYHFRFDPNQPKVEEFNLNSSYSDKSFLRRQLAWEVYAASGDSACLAFNWRVQQNGAFHSVATFVEQLDQDYLKRNQLDPNGALYKMFNAAISATIDVEKKTRLWEDHSDLQELIDGIALNNPDRVQYLFDHLDLPAMVNYLAATSLLHDNDHLGKNYYLYRESDGDGEWRMLPWDKDLTFGRNFTIAGLVLNDTIWADNDPYSHPLFGDRNHRKVDNIWNILIDAFYASPVLQEMVMRRLRSLMDLQLQPPWTPTGQLLFEQRIGEMQTELAPDVALDLSKWGPSWGMQMDFQAGLDQILNDFLPRRRDHLYLTHGPPAGLIPTAQPGGISVSFGAFEPDPASGQPLEEYFELINPNPTAVDLSGWRLGGDLSFDFPAGAVLAAGQKLYLSPDLNAFRARTSGPMAGLSLVALGPYLGDLQVGASLQLYDQFELLVAATNGPILVARNFKAGQTAILQTVDAAAGADILFAYSLAGPGPTQTSLGMAELSAPIWQAGVVQADLYGNAYLTSLLPPFTAGLNIWVQAVDLNQATFTNSLGLVIQ